MILYSTGDLMWASRLRVASDSVGIQARPARRDTIADQIETTGATGLLVELDGSDEPFDLIRRATEASPTLQVVAFGPHVSPDLLARASEAGAGQVLTRGALMGTVEAVLTRLGTEPAGEG